jgi:hypothetical protein
MVLKSIVFLGVPFEYEIEYYVVRGKIFEL